MTQRIPLNDAWEFTEQWSPEFLTGGAADTVPADLPHTCRETPYDYFDESRYQMVCGYRRQLRVPRKWAGKRIFLHVAAAGHLARVYVDGEAVGEHACGYTAFRLELTGRLTPGTSALLAIEVDSRESLDQPPFGYVVDYMTYGGLYREVWLEVTEPTFISDVFVHPDAPGKLDATVTVDGPDSGAQTLRQSVRLRDETERAAAGAFARNGRETGCTLLVPHPRLWDIDTPHLYVLTTELWDGDTLLDSRETVFGFRRAEWRADGFYLNSRKVKLRGLNRHQSYPYVGYAAPASLQRLDAELLKNELGCNAVRTSHYPQSQHFLDRCDELGLLVFTEIPGWQHIGGEDWKRQAVENTREMVLQYRNHPSIILWGVRINESQDDDALYTRTNAAAHALDPTRPTSGVRCHKKSSLLEDVYAYNDFLHDGSAPGCEPKKAVTSDMGKAYLVSEYNGHMFPTKTFDSEAHRMEHALRHAAVLDAVCAQEDIAGSFGWCMFDYNTHKDFGSGDRICYHGVMDMFRNKKWAADVYASQGDGEPVLTVTSGFDIGERATGNRGRIFLLTNADSVRVYKNDVFIREYTHADSPYKHLRRGPIELTDFVGDALKAEGFAPRQEQYVKDLLNHSARFGNNHLPADIMAKAGVLMTRYHMTFGDAYALYGKYIGDWGAAATTYRFEAVKDGVVVKTVLKTPMTHTRLEALPSSTELVLGETYDAALVRLAMTDQNGNVLPFCQAAVELKTEGPIRVLGPKAATLRGGLGGTLVRTAGKAGKARLTLTADGCRPVIIEFNVTDGKEKEES